MSGYFNGTWHSHWLISSDDLMINHDQSLLYRSGRICLDFFSTIFFQKTVIIWARVCTKKRVLAKTCQNTSLSLKSNNSDFIPDVYHNRRSLSGLVNVC